MLFLRSIAGVGTRFGQRPLQLRPKVVWRRYHLLARGPGVQPSTLTFRVPPLHRVQHGNEANHGCRTAPPNRQGPVRTHGQQAHLTPRSFAGPARRGRERPPRDGGCAATSEQAHLLPYCRLSRLLCCPSRILSSSYHSSKRRRLLSREHTYQHGSGQTPPPPGRLSAVATPLPVAFQVLRTPFGTGIDRTTRFCAVVRALSHPKKPRALPEILPDGVLIRIDFALTSALTSSSRCRLGPLRNPAPLARAWASSLGRLDPS